MSYPINVLFVCTHNAGRSQMAAALLNREGCRDMHGLSAGTDPTQEVNPTVCTVLAEVGIPLTDTTPAPITMDLIAQANYIIAMGGDDNGCVAGTPGLFINEVWEIPDPAGQPLDRVREIRDLISHKVHRLARSA
jgi:arsenate reductase (thioredoxin)